MLCFLRRVPHLIKVFTGASPSLRTPRPCIVDEVRASLCGFKALASRTPWPLLLGVAGQGYSRPFASWLPSPDSLARLWFCSLQQKNVAPACVSLARSNFQHWLLNPRSQKEEQILLEPFKLPGSQWPLPDMQAPLISVIMSVDQITDVQQDLSVDREQ